MTVITVAGIGGILSLFNTARNVSAAFFTGFGAISTLGRFFGFLIVTILIILLVILMFRVSLCAL